MVNYISSNFSIMSRVMGGTLHSRTITIDIKAARKGRTKAALISIRDGDGFYQIGPHRRWFGGLTLPELPCPGATASRPWFPPYELGNELGYGIRRSCLPLGGLDYGFDGLRARHANWGKNSVTGLVDLASFLEDWTIAKYPDPASALSSSSRLSSVHCGCEGVGVVDVVDVGRWVSVLCVICLITHFS
jgi:hypothetical protein